MSIQAQLKIEERSIPVPGPGCWLWLATIGKNGYGRNSTGKRSYQEAHRASYEAFRGNIPAGMCVCHKCDTPTCVNPDHLFLGTHQQNMMDRARKVACGLRPAAKNSRVNGWRGHTHGYSYNRGQSNGKSKLTAEQVREIRSMAGTQRQIAQRFGVSRSAINDILSGRNWRSNLAAMEA